MGILYTDTELIALEEAEIETQRSDPVWREIRYAAFRSYSKGRNRKRRYPQEVELVGYRGRFHLHHNFPYDTVATEVYGDNRDGAEEQLRREAPLRAFRG